MLATAFLLGLMGSLHCMGMCGPIAFMLPLDRGPGPRRYGQLALYHLGRMLAYGMIGLVFGAVGRTLYVFGFQQKLSILLGGLMVLSVLIPWGRVPNRGIAGPVYRLVGRLKNALGGQLKKRTADTFLTIGLLNGFLPCGLVYMALIGAIAMGSAPQGALYMVLFGVGTLPLMSAAALLGKFLKTRWTTHLRKAVPILIALIGVLFILRGMGLGIPYVSPELTESTSMGASLECQP